MKNSLSKILTMLFCASSILALTSCEQNVESTPVDTYQDLRNDIEESENSRNEGTQYSQDLYEDSFEN